MDKMAGKDTITAQLDTILTEYQEDTDAIVAAAAKTAANKCRKDIRNASPVLTGRYKQGWTVKNDSKRELVTYIVHNKTDYQLTHLLEKSHVIKNQYGTYGRSTPEVHIAPAAEQNSEYFVELVEQELQR